MPIPILPPSRAGKLKAVEKPDNPEGRQLVLIPTAGLIAPPSAEGKLSRFDFGEAAGEKPDLLPYGRNDDGNAERMLALYGPSLRYCHAIKHWLLWNGCLWVVDKTEIVRKLARRMLIELLQQCSLSSVAPDAGSRIYRERDGGSELEKFAEGCLNSKAITSLLRMLQSDVPIEPSELNLDPYLLNFQNGTVDLRTGKLRPHRREDFITKLVHYDYRPAAQCPLWKEFLLQAMGGNMSMVKYLQIALGYSLTGSTIEKAVFVPFGPGNGGKSTFLTAFRYPIKEYSASIQIDSLLVRQDSPNIQADLADLRGARFVQTSESEKGAQMSPAKLKRITQGMGSLKAVRKYENWIEFPETHKLWIDTNHRPVITDGDEATFNRIHPIPFLVSIPKDKIDRDLLGKLAAEAEGILAWAVEGARLWREKGLSRPPAVEAANQAWRAESDSLASFITERCRCLPGASVAAQRLFELYRRWSEGAGARAGEGTLLSQREFSARILERPGITKKHTKKGWFYMGIEQRGGRVGAGGFVGVSEKGDG